MSGLGFDAQSFIDAYSMDDCEACGGEGVVSDEGLRLGYPIQVICPACDGSGYQDAAEEPN
jgi:DnaJ-class molecular chaperone